MNIPFLPLKDINAAYSAQISEALSRSVQSGWYINGTELTTFERHFATYVGTAHVIGVGNGLDALTLALQAMKSYYGWADNDEVVVPDMTFVATALAVVRAGLRPVFADVDENCLLSAQTAQKAISPRTRCLLPVHLYGHVAPMGDLLQLAKTYGLQVLEDAAQAHGAEYQHCRAGSIGTMAAFSFYPGKNLGALGDAGAVCTNNEQLATRVRILANYGAKRKYEHTELGVNSRMDELQAAVLSAKLPYLDCGNTHRRHAAALYAELIRHKEVTIPYGGATNHSVFHIYPVRCRRREELMLHLRRHGIETLIHYPHPLTAQRALRPYTSEAAQASCTEAQKWACEELSLPISPIITDEEVKYVAETINSFC